MKLGDDGVELVEGEDHRSAEAHEPGERLDDLARLLAVHGEAEGFPLVVFERLPLQPGHPQAGDRDNPPSSGR